ncbi:MAG: 4Fe-4S dicluster domain-containing protein [Dehalococcoidales bacterium]|nr:4Fe-4S dicluster domain-containing protein [Dehalococcoidales bacterium]
MELTRRDFLKTTGCAVGLALVSSTLSSDNVEALAGDRNMTIQIDVGKCSGCWKCHTACTKQNNLNGVKSYDPNHPYPLSGEDWVALLPTKRGKAWRFRKHSCMHCTDASCLEVCPTGAISRNGEAVVINQDWCTGCGYCVQACPFGIPHKDETTGTARKCDFCIGRVSQGGMPACVEICPAKAMHFGTRTDMIDSATARVTELVGNGYADANIYGVNELGGMHVIYVLDGKPSVYGLPDVPKSATSNSPVKWVSGLTAFGLALAPMWLVLKKRGQNDAKVKEARK